MNTWWTLDSSTKIILRVIGIVLALILIWVIRDILMVLLLALVLASAMEPLVAYFQTRRIPRYVSVLAVYTLVIIIVGAVFSAIVPVSISQFNVLAANLPIYADQVQEHFPSLGLLLGESNFREVSGNVLSSLTGEQTLLTRTVGIFNGLFALVTVLVVSFYLVAEQQGLPKLVDSLVPKKHIPFTLGLIRKVQIRMGRWVIGQVILSVAIFLLTFIGLTILGVNNALFLALLAGLLEVLPYIGPFIAAVPAVFFALIQSPALALAVAVLYIIVQKTEGYFLVPKVMERTVGTSPLLVLVALLVGFKLAGILGLLLAVPLVSAITLILSEMYAHNEVNRLEAPKQEL